MTTYLGKSCSFCLPRVPFVNCCQFMYLVISLLVWRAGYEIWLYQFLIIAYLFTLPYKNWIRFFNQENTMTLHGPLTRNVTLPTPVLVWSRVPATLKMILSQEFKSLSFKTSFGNIKIIVYNCLEFDIGKSYRPYMGPILGTVTYIFAFLLIRCAYQSNEYNHSRKEGTQSSPK